MRYYSILLILVLFPKVADAQKISSNQIRITVDSMKTEIVKVLAIVKAGRSEILKNPNTLNIYPIEEVNRVQYPELWETQTREHIKLYLFTLNELGNYIEDDVNKNFVRTSQIIPPCYIDTSFIQYPHQPKIDEIFDPECKRIFLQMLKDQENMKMKNEYLMPIYVKYSRVAQELVTMFEWSKYSSVKQMGEYLSPIEKQYFDTPQKLNFFKKTISHFSYNKN